MKVFLWIALLVMPLSVNAETPAECKKRLNNEVECFISNAAATRLLCSLSVELALLDSTAADKARTCVSAARPRVAGHYKAALARLSKNPTGTAILKDTYAAWQTTIGALFPNSGERKFQYDARLAAQEQALEQKFNRLKLEAQ